MLLYRFPGASRLPLRSVILAFAIRKITWALNFPGHSLGVMNAFAVGTYARLFAAVNKHCGILACCARTQMRGLDLLSQVFHGLRSHTGRLNLIYVVGLGRVGHCVTRRVSAHLIGVHGVLTRSASKLSLDSVSTGSGPVRQPPPSSRSLPMMGHSR